jgi:hypothetical protein
MRATKSPLAKRSLTLFSGYIESIKTSIHRITCQTRLCVIKKWSERHFHCSFRLSSGQVDLDGEATLRLVSRRFTSEDSLECSFRDFFFALGLCG